MGRWIAVKGHHVYVDNAGDDASTPSGQGSDRHTSTEAWHNSLQDHHKQALQEFTSGNFSAMRKMDRDGLQEDDDYKGSVHRETRDKVNSLNEALATAPHHAGTVYRGMRDLNHAEAAATFTEGAELQTEAVTSFTKSQKDGAHFAHTSDSVQGHQGGPGHYPRTDAIAGEDGRGPDRDIVLG